jgi:hypothetical protein
MERKVDNLATEEFWSRSAIAFGRTALRYKLTPTLPKTQSVKTPSNLREEF